MQILAISPVFSVLWLASLAFAIYVIVDMAKRPSWQWRAAGSNKVLWLVLEIVLLIGLLSILVGIIYLAVVRPRLETVARQGGGPWAGGPGWPGQPSQWGGQPYGGPGQPYGRPGQPYGGTGQPWGGAPPTSPGQPPVGPPGPWAYPGTGTAGSQAPYGQAPQAPPPPVENPPFGWYEDPSGRHEKRYWDGTRWTEHVSDGEVRSSDPVTG